MELNGASDEMLTASAPLVLRRVVEEERERESKKERNLGSEREGWKHTPERERESERRKGRPAGGWRSGGVGNCTTNHATLRRYGPLLAL